MSESEKLPEPKLGLSSWIAIFTAITTVLGGFGFSVGKSVGGPASETPATVKNQSDIQELSKVLSEERLDLSRLQWRVQMLERQQGYDSSDPDNTPGYPRKRKQ
jgi:hypothetical protein